MSIAGGLPRAVERAVLHGCEALQIFSKSANRWRARPLPEDEVAEFRSALARSGIFPAIAHASHLINLATGSPALRAQSIASFGEELDRAEALGLMGVVLHPGAWAPQRGRGAGDPAWAGSSETEALNLIAGAIRGLLNERRRAKVMVLLEHIGRGEIGLAAFRRLLNDGRLEALPMLLETPKTGWRTGVPEVDPLDEMNLETLRRLRKRGRQ